MGKRTGGTTPPNGGGGTNGSSSLLQQILDFIKDIYKEVEPHIETVELNVGATFQELFPGTKKVRFGLIQNISTENITLYTISAGQVAAKGICLTKANGAGEGGGSLPVGRIDLAKIWFVRATAGLSISVYYES